MWILLISAVIFIIFGGDQALQLSIKNDSGTSITMLSSRGIFPIEAGKILEAHAEAGGIKICSEGKLNVYEIDSSEGSAYWTYLQDSKVNLILQKDTQMAYTKDFIEVSPQKLKHRIDTQPPEERCKISSQ